jgi:hypothetical protein
MHGQRNWKPTWKSFSTCGTTRLCVQKTMT